MPSESDKWGWKHVSVFGGFDKGSGTKRWKCNYCSLRYNGSYSRVRAHLLGSTGVGVKSCPAIDRSLRDALQILEEERLARKKKRISGSGKSSKRIRNSQPSLSSVWKASPREDIDDSVARFFYANGLNFNILNSPYFHDMAKAIAAFGPGYEPPPVEKLSSSFLHKEKTRIDKAMGPIRESWLYTGCTILCLNRLDCALGSFSSNVFVSSPRGFIFLQTLEINEGNKADNVLAGVLNNVIMEVGPRNVVQIIMHPRHSSKSSESLIQSKFPQIFWSPCTSYSIHMLMEDIAELDWVKPIVLCAKGIEQYVLTQHSSLSVFSQNLKESFGPTSVKLSPSYRLVQRIVELKQALQELALSEEWRQWKLTFPEDFLSIEAAILGNEFWSGAHMVLQLFEPFVRLLGLLNIDECIIGDVYNWRVQALEAVRSKGIDEIILKQLEVLIENRWETLFSPLHATGYILNPRYFGKGQCKDKSIMRGWKATLERYECDGTDRRVLREQISSYWRLEGSLGEEDALDCRDKMDAVAWWENFGSETPQLQTLAIKILSQISSISTFQVSWYENSFCREAANSLEADIAADLLFVRNNLRLQGRKIGNSNSSSVRT
ncbi:PREDICTED: uncharacterized protein LOC104612511 isoform X2 [Nelumbo nucifera]|nr:PREDICTED: uncharacterized protein LOC104612511 isoform X2 [Nelumbo nucifera]DAD28697.1 TPA_asm: hypothetical protein HUJ06_030165 [Nelumbo nucifera]